MKRGRASDEARPLFHRAASDKFGIHNAYFVIAIVYRQPVPWLSLRESCHRRRLRGQAKTRNWCRLPVLPFLIARHLQRNDHIGTQTSSRIPNSAFRIIHSPCAISPLVSITATFSGISLPLRAIAVRTARSRPPQQGTVIRQRVTLFTSCRMNISRSFWA